MTVSLDSDRTQKSTQMIFRIGEIIVAVLLLLALKYLYHAMRYESTDDATIMGPIVDMSPKVFGQVTRVLIRDNQEVKSGALLVEIDPRDTQARLKEARARLSAAEADEQLARVDVTLTEVTARAGVKQESAGVAAATLQVRARAGSLREAQAELRARQAEANLAELDLARYRNLYAKDEVSRQQLDQAEADFRRAKANSEAAQARIRTALQNLRQARSQVGQAIGQFQKVDVVPQQMAESRARLRSAIQRAKEAAAALRTAELNASYTKIKAPTSGRITKKSVEAGSYVQVGQTLFSIVPHDVWVIANFKETQLTRMHPGQPAEIHVDAYPHHRFEGHVESIQSGTGSAFSLLPPENATGNYVKVVQRVPVKILFDKPIDPSYQLSPGMSVVPEVKVK